MLQSARFVTMKPETSESVDVFMVLYKKFGFCKLSSVRIDDNQHMMLNDTQQRCPFLITVKNISFREAWEIGVDDQDSTAILPDDNLMIPEEHKTDAPVIELLKRKR